MWVMNAICRPFRNIGSFCATLPYSLSRGQINARVCCKLKLIVLKQKQKFNTVARVSILRPSFGWKILSIKLDTDGETGSIFFTNPTMHLSHIHNAPFRAEICTFLFWMVHWEIHTLGNTYLLKSVGYLHRNTYISQNDTTWIVVSKKNFER